MDVTKLPASAPPLPQASFVMRLSPKIRGFTYASAVFARIHAYDSAITCADTASAMRFF
jgi:hypothetical protein